MSKLACCVAARRLNYDVDCSDISRAKSSREGVFKDNHFDPKTNNGLQGQE